MLNAYPYADALAVLPQGCKVLSTETHGQSFWAKPGSINVELANGAPFVKVISEDTGKKMVRSQFQSIGNL